MSPATVSPGSAAPRVSARCGELLAKIAAFYDRAPADSGWFGRRYRQLLAHYYRHLIPADSSILEIGCASAELLSFLPNADVTGVDVSERQVLRARQRVPRGNFHVQAGECLNLDRTFDFIILSDTLNFAVDAQLLFTNLLRVSTPRTRLILNYHSNLWRPILGLATWLKLKMPGPAANWFTTQDVANLLALSDWERLKVAPRILAPFPLLGLDALANRFLAPFFSLFCLSVFAIARPRTFRAPAQYSASVIIPVRNEAGNIEEAVRRVPSLGSGTEIVFIEGHSTDETWEAVQKAAQDHPGANIRCMRQTGKGKGNAVREAFEAASGDIVMILDGDLTVPPEELPKFYDALASGKSEFANGVRLVYPMDDRAMQFLNMCANKTFGLIFTWLLGQPVKDTLCGTKALFKRDYNRIAANRSYFGDFDPFGDFDLLFGADKLHLKITDVPIRYRERQYGSTNIQRWRHGVLLLRMVLLAAKKLKFV